MRRILALLLVVFVLLPFFASAEDTGSKDQSLQARLKYAHEMVRFWWSIYTIYRTTKSYKLIHVWKIECTRLMAEAEK